FHLRHCPNPLLVQLLSYGHHQLMLTFLVKETAGSIKAERPESSDDMTSWSCSQHQKLWMRTELQDLGLWPGSPPVRNPGNAISLPRVIVGTGGQYYIMSSRLCCKACRRFWFADSPRWLEKLPKRFTNLLPAFLTYKKAICKSVMDELRRTGHSPGDMANQVNELMQLKYERAHLAYLHAIESVREAEAGVYGQRTIGRFLNHVPGEGAKVPNWIPVRELVAELNSAFNRVTGQEKYPVLHSSHRDTGEKFGL
ncbi:hypothetical protein NHX12_028166, partial [Muraenolepis orangiensis]